MEIFDILRFAVDKRSDLTMTDAYTEVGNVSLDNCDMGTYEYGLSLTSIFDQTNKSEYLRFSTDGGNTWYEFSSEPADKTDDNPTSYNFFLENMSGDLNFQVQARKEDATGVMSIHFVDTYIRRVA